jgi:hypothetical protein
MQVDGFKFESGYPDHLGKLRVLAVPAGDYQFYVSPLNQMARPTQVPRAKITVAAREVVYRGEYFLIVACGLKTLGVFRDEEEGNLALLRERNPKVADLSIVKRLPVFDERVLGQ